MLVEIDTTSGRKKIRVCDYCRTVCIPSGRFCSGFCARGFAEANRIRKPVADNNSDGADVQSAGDESE